MKKSLRIIDLFAGIGGTRLGFEQAGFVSVYSNEIDKAACETYHENFKENPEGDITKVDPKKMLDFDVLVGGFPCQAFSIAGKKMGFNDTRGTLFFDVARILKEKKPKAFLLENVAHLQRHNKGNTFKTIADVLREDLKYDIFYKVVNAKNFGLPQNRSRILIVGFRNDLGIKDFEIPEKYGDKKITIGQIKEKNVPSHYFVSKIWYRGMKEHKKRHQNKGNGFGFMVLDDAGIANTIVCGGMGKERNLVIDSDSIKNFADEELRRINSDYVRYLTPREMARLQGFPESFKLPEAKTRAYKQLANSVPVPAIRETAIRIRKVLEKSSI